MNRNNQKHGFHLVDVSPWPIISAVSAPFFIYKMLKNNSFFKTYGPVVNLKVTFLLTTYLILFRLFCITFYYASLLSLDLFLSSSILVQYIIVYTIIFLLIKGYIRKRCIHKKAVLFVYYKFPLSLSILYMNTSTWIQNFCLKRLKMSPAQALKYGNFPASGNGIVSAVIGTTLLSIGLCGLGMLYSGGSVEKDPDSLPDALVDLNILKDIPKKYKDNVSHEFKKDSLAWSDISVVVGELENKFPKEFDYGLLKDKTGNKYLVVYKEAGSLDVSSSINSSGMTCSSSSTPSKYKTFSDIFFKPLGETKMIPDPIDIKSLQNDILPQNYNLNIETGLENFDVLDSVVGNQSEEIENSSSRKYTAKLEKRELDNTEQFRNHIQAHNEGVTRAEKRPFDNAFPGHVVESDNNSSKSSKTED